MKGSLYYCQCQCRQNCIIIKKPVLVPLILFRFARFFRLYFKIFAKCKNVNLKNSERCLLVCQVQHLRNTHYRVGIIELLCILQLNFRK